MANRGRDILMSVPLFSELSKRHVKRVADVMEEERYHEGASIVREGEEGDSMYVLVEGQADVVRDDRTVDRLLPGDFFGEISLLDGGPRTATIVADTPITVLAIRRDPFNRMLTQEPEIAVKILTALARRLRFMMRRQR
ncbi:MAG: cyclic nucleotide-binding domain-containing protein [Actinomycetota bacterium]